MTRSILTIVVLLAGCRRPLPPGDSSSSSSSSSTGTETDGTETGETGEICGVPGVPPCRDQGADD